MKLETIQNNFTVWGQIKSDIFMLPQTVKYAGIEKYFTVWGQIKMSLFMLPQTVKCEILLFYKSQILI